MKVLSLRQGDCGNSATLTLTLETGKMGELDSRAVRANKIGATFKLELVDGEEKVTGGFTSWDQIVAFYQDSEGKGGRERAFNYASNTARGMLNHETVASHPLSRLAKQMVSSGMYFAFSGDTSKDVEYTAQVGTPQKGKSGEKDYEAASSDFAPAKYKGLKKVITFIEAQKAKVAA